jgi:ribose transport system permease protein
MINKQTEDISPVKVHSQKEGSLLKSFGMLFRSRTLLLLLITLGIGIVLSIVSPYFLTVGNISTLLFGLSADGIVTTGMVMVMIIGEIDLSVGGIMAMTGVITGSLYLSGINIWFSSLIGFILGVTAGVGNGYFNAKLKINSFIVTLAMMGLTQGIAYIFTLGSPLALGNLPSLFTNLGSGKVNNLLPYFTIIYAVIVVITAIFIKELAVLKKMYYVGSSPSSAQLVGINVVKVKWLAFIISGALASLAGILTVARFTVATPQTGQNEALTAIAAAVIGGTSFTGGEGSIVGAVLGVFIVSMVDDGLILLNVSVYWQYFVNGLILISVVVANELLHRRLENR